MRHVLSHGLMGLRDLLSFFLSFLDVIKRIFPVTTSNQGDRCFQSGICGFKVIPIRQLNPRESKGGRKPLRLQISELRNGDLFFFINPGLPNNKVYRSFLRLPILFLQIQESKSKKSTMQWSRSRAIFVRRSYRSRLFRNIILFDCSWVPPVSFLKAEYFVFIVLIFDQVIHISKPYMDAQIHEPPRDPSFS